MKNHKFDSRKAIFALIVLSMIYSFLAIIARYLQVQFTVLQQLYLRIFIAIIVGFLILSKHLDFGKLKKISQREWILLFTRAGVFMIAGTLWVKAATMTKLANLTFIDAIPMSAVLGFIILKEKVTWQKVVLLVLSVFGVLLIAVKDYSDLTIWGAGEVMVLVASLFFAVRNITRRFHSSLLSDMEITQIMFVFGFFQLFLASLAIGEGLPSFQSITIGVAIALLLGAIFNIANLFLINYGYSRLPAVLASNILMLEVVFGIFFGFFIYMEIPTAKELMGGMLIVSSVFFMNRLK